MSFLDIVISTEVRMTFLAIVAFGAGLIRGFTGFGGAAFMLAILTIFYSPISIVAKILVVDFGANIYLFKSCYKKINWPSTLALVIPTLIFMPLGHWFLTEIDPLWMKRVIAITIAFACLMMLIGYRYKTAMTRGWLICIGIIAGIIFGASYIALIAVVAILLGPYNKDDGRNLIVAWSFFTVLGFAALSALWGTTTLNDIYIALPAAGTYMLGTWLGSKGFSKSSEKLFRSITVSCLLALAMFNLVS